MLSGRSDRLAGLDPAALLAPVAERKKIGLAVSGGPDSLALLVLFSAWRETAAAPEAVVYTLDHGLRPESAAEAEMVRRIAVEEGFVVRVLRWKGDKPQAGLPAAARAARYRLIGEAMRADGAEVLVTAHHLDDQAETVLMRLAHGSGAGGLGAMRAFADVEGVKVFRPLLGVPKDKLAAIVAAHGLDAAIDPTNADPGYERARWRAMWPTLDAAGLTSERLARFAQRMQRLDALAEEVAADLWRAEVSVDDFGVIHIAANVFGGVQEEAGLRILWRALRHAGARQQGDLLAVETLYRQISRDEVTAPVTLMGAVVAPGSMWVLVYREAGRKGLPRVHARAGDVTVWDGRFSVESPVALTIAPALALTRERFVALTGEAPDVPVAALRTAPLVSTEDGEVLALGARLFDARIKVNHVALT
ncbi:tRNA lysidine(34) synthetase TilS [Pelagibacterium sediminicola]|uniref:tRNA lysidine(34) synthetase TilS n=1 Tax=Pelagibacterium sediminicola TaxID=2248761 RepID=UPI000E31780E|nr:tRNA lysidine(34) synthetase TilS [Pelagibacterium sediminicola]